MDNYNPRQNTRMRWKDAKELEKFKFITGAFCFQNETLEHVSQDKLYSKLVEIINDSRPVLVYDTVNCDLSIGNVDSGNMYLTTLYNNTGSSYALTYDEGTDKLRIEAAEENFISEDHVKTLFGNDIIGTGNITLFRHVITLRGTDSNGSTYSTIFTIYSSSNLKINSVQDLNKVLKPTDGMLIQVSTLLEGQHFSLTEYNGMQYNASAQVWKVGSVNSDVAKVSGKSYLQEDIFNVSSISNDEVIAL